MNITDKIFVVGHLGMVGSSIVRLLKKLGWKSNTSLKDGLKTTYNWYISNLNR